MFFVRGFQSFGCKAFIGFERIFIAVEVRAYIDGSGIEFESRRTSFDIDSVL